MVSSNVAMVIFGTKKVKSRKVKQGVTHMMTVTLYAKNIGDLQVQMRKVRDISIERGMVIWSIAFSPMTITFYGEAYQFQVRAELLTIKAAEAALDAEKHFNTGDDLPF